jgi:hypothetical protein
MLLNKALSIKQPWAQLIALGVKDIENRTWKTNLRGRIFIHAPAKYIEMPKNRGIMSLFTPEQWEVADQHLRNKFRNLPISAIIGEVDIVDCVINHESIWAEKTSSRAFADEQHYFDKPIWNWVLENAEIYEKPKLYVRGKLNFWNYTGEPLEDKIIKRINGEKR